MVMFFCALSHVRPSQTPSYDKNKCYYTKRRKNEPTKSSLQNNYSTWLLPSL